ncbi:MAG: hypothetical protein EA381_09430 [Planctomycetaceae bacterium]|nr:MAG: hypothetical protein EA381_09430 [Planctomycetaceae bacterium]
MSGSNGAESCLSHLDTKTIRNLFLWMPNGGWSPPPFSRRRESIRAWLRTRSAGRLRSERLKFCLPI